MENKFKVGDKVKSPGGEKGIITRIESISWVDVKFNNGLNLNLPSLYLEFDLDEYKSFNSCTCGAKYTSFAKHHLNWCDSLGNSNDTNK